MRQQPTPSGAEDRRKNTEGIFGYPASIRARLVTIVLAVAIPLNLMVLAVLWDLARAADASFRASLLFSARSIAGAVDAQLGKYIALSETLAQSPTLLDSDPNAFEDEAHRAFSQTPNVWVVVADLNGRKLIDTSSRGQTLANRDESALKAQNKALAAGRSVVSDVLFAQDLNRWVVTVETPILKDGNPFRVLAVVASIDEIAALLNESETPRNWLTGVIDERGDFIARVPDTGVIGKPGSEGWRAVRTQEGVFEIRSREGDPIINANARPRLADWTVGVAVKKSELNAATARAALWSMALGAAISLLSLMLALALGRRIVQPIDDLRRSAAALLDDRQAQFAASFPELDELWTSLKRAADERRESNAALQSSERRLRLAAEAARFGVHEYDPARERGVWTKEMRRLVGGGDDADENCLVLPNLHPEDAARVKREMEQTIRRAGPYELEFRLVGPSGDVRWMLDRGEALGPLDERTGLAPRVIGTLLDITERKRSEEHATMLMREVTHRAKNMLGVVLAIARRTNAEDYDEFIRRFTARVQALSASQDLLIANDWKSVDVRAMIGAQLEQFIDRVGDRIRLVGPSLRLDPTPAHAIGMALHELLSNAANHGALSNDAGAVAIEWKVDDHLFSMRWAERGGPRVSRPGRDGFGHTIMTSVVSATVGGPARLDFAPDGVVWTLTCPADNVLQKCGRPMQADPA